MVRADITLLCIIICPTANIENYKMKAGKAHDFNRGRCQGDKCFTEWQLRTQMAKNKEWYNRPWYKKLAWRVKLMFS